MKVVMPMLFFRKKPFAVLAFLFAAGSGSLLSIKMMSTQAATPNSGSPVELAEVDEAVDNSPAPTRVITVCPKSGGTVRSTELPCSAHWYDSADLYAKVSGYLGEMNVDIGSRVKTGELLATIDVPELDEDVVLATAALNYQFAAVAQFDARRKTAQAEFHASEAACVKAAADVERWIAEVAFRTKELGRLKALHATNSVQEALVDEKLFQLQSVQAAQHAAETVVLTAKEQAAAAAARVELADADLAVSRMQTKMEEARLKKAKLYASFSQIKSPYDGVITARRFHTGEFIRSADKSVGEAIFSVGRTDVIRVVVHIPDRDVPFANPGDPVVTEFDTLPGHKFAGKLARIAYTEDPRTRTMRAEVDLPNEENLIVDQMYGRMRIELQPAAKTLTVPSVCLVGDLTKGKGTVFVVKEGIARLQSISVGLHDGIQVEVIDGLGPDDVVVVRPPAGLRDGAAVAADADVTRS